MDIVLKLLLLIDLLFLVMITLGLLGIIGHVVHWVVEAWSGTTEDHDSWLSQR